MTGIHCSSTSPFLRQRLACTRPFGPNTHSLVRCPRRSLPRGPSYLGGKHDRAEHSSLRGLSRLSWSCRFMGAAGRQLHAPIIGQLFQSVFRARGGRIACSANHTESLQLSGRSTAFTFLPWIVVVHRRSLGVANRMSSWFWWGRRRVPPQRILAS